MQRQKTILRKFVENSKPSKQSPPALFSTLISQSKSSSQLLIESNIRPRTILEESQILNLEGNSFLPTYSAFKEAKKGKPSIDSNSRSIPLTQLIMSDNGYGQLFQMLEEKIDSQKLTLIEQMETKVKSNINVLVEQTDTLISLYEFTKLLADEYQIKSQITIITNEIQCLRKKKRKSPSKYYICQQRQQLKLKENLLKQRRKNQRTNAKLLQVNNFVNTIHKTSTAKTQCDSKIPSIPSSPVTPVSRNNFDKAFKKERFFKLCSHKQIIKEAINTYQVFYQKKQQQIKEQMINMEQEIKLINEEMSSLNQLKKSQNNRSSRFQASPRMHNRILMRSKSPKSERKLLSPLLSKKQQFLNRISAVKTQLSDDYYITKQ